MATRNSIAKLALMKIGAPDPYVTPNGNLASRTIDLVWTDVFRAVIRGTGAKQPKWNFALKYGEVAARAAPPENPVPFPWTSAFVMPAGFVRLAEIVAPDGANEYWKSAGAEILTRTGGPLKFWYISDTVAPEVWDASFVQAFAARLAFEIADTVAGDPQRRATCYQEFEGALAAAAKVDAVENPPTFSVEDDWVEARNGGVGTQPG